MKIAIFFALSTTFFLGYAWGVAMVKKQLKMEDKHSRVMIMIAPVALVAISILVVYCLNDLHP